VATLLVRPIRPHQHVPPNLLAPSTQTWGRAATENNQRKKSVAHPGTLTSPITTNLDLNPVDVNNEFVIVIVHTLYRDTRYTLFAAKRYDGQASAGLFLQELEVTMRVR
jgi:hypothetical protein